MYTGHVSPTLNLEPQPWRVGAIGVRSGSRPSADPAVGSGSSLSPARLDTVMPDMVREIMGLLGGLCSAPGRCWVVMGRPAAGGPGVREFSITARKANQGSRPEPKWDVSMRCASRARLFDPKNYYCILRDRKSEEFMLLIKE